jgi:hypothetical protein
MMPAPAVAALPSVLRDIVETDRRLAAARAAVLPLLHDVRKLTALRADQRRRAHHLYGRAPLRGETGPGRPTAARA